MKLHCSILGPGEQQRPIHHCDVKGDKQVGGWSAQQKVSQQLLPPADPVRPPNACSSSQFHSRGTGEQTCFVCTEKYSFGVLTWKPGCLEVWMKIKPEKYLGLHIVVLAWGSRSGLPEAQGQQVVRQPEKDFGIALTPTLRSSLADWPPPCQSWYAQAMCQQLAWPYRLYQICLLLALLNSKTPWTDPHLGIFLTRILEEMVLDLDWAMT